MKEFLVCIGFAIFIDFVFNNADTLKSIITLFKK